MSAAGPLGVRGVFSVVFSPSPAIARFASVLGRSQVIRSSPSNVYGYLFR